MGFSEKINPIIEAQHFSEKILNEKITAPPFNYLRQGRLFKDGWDLAAKDWIIPAKCEGFLLRITKTPRI